MAPVLNFTGVVSTPNVSSSRKKTTSGTKKRKRTGRKTNTRNYTGSELNTLLSVIQDVLPLSSDDWNMVEKKYNALVGAPNSASYRDIYSLKRK